MKDSIKKLQEKGADYLDWLNTRFSDYNSPEQLINQ